MAKKVWKRVFRPGKLTSEKVERDRKLRRLIQASGKWIYQDESGKPAVPP